jgi:predicted RNA-binding Zn-ribbon protein involved in translation (DUF1610 family)
LPSLDYFNPQLPPDYHFSVNELPPEEQTRLRAQFAPLLRSHRRRHRIAVLFMVLGVPACVLTVALDGPLWPPLLISYLPALAIALRSPRLLCPNCGNKIAKPRGPFCPDCAKRALMPGGLFTPPKCQACGKAISPNNQKNYTIHACTHCGLWLDDRGVRFL